MRQGFAANFAKAKFDAAHRVAAGELGTQQITLARVADSLRKIVFGIGELGVCGRGIAQPKARRWPSRRLRDVVDLAGSAFDAKKLELGSDRAALFD